MNKKSYIHEWDEEKLRSYYRGSEDIKISTNAFGETGETFTLVYCEGMGDSKQLSETVLPSLEQSFRSGKSDSEAWTALQARLELTELQSDEDLSLRLFSGALLLLHHRTKRFFAHNMENIPKRTPSESLTEISLKGPRDGFTEELSTNVALIRKRLRTSKLHNEKFTLGDHSRTEVSLMHISGIAPSALIKEARDRIKAFESESLLSSSQLEEALGDSKSPLFPLIDYIGRPDFVAESLVRGRLAVLMNGSPMALIFPSNLLEQIKSPEDLHLPYYFVAFERLLRMIGLFVAIFLPGFWVALCAFNSEQLPFRLLATVANSRVGLPLSVSMEAVLMLGMFELFREAGARLPKAVGQTVAVVGGLIVGDAAIRAGLTSPTMLVVSAVTAVSTFTLVNLSLSGTVSVMRLYVLIVSSVLGMFGFFIGMFSIVVYLSGLSSLGIGYLEPLSPVSFKDILKAVLDVPKRWKDKKPVMLRRPDLEDKE
ncbi:spore germination protein [Cohnella nanjingensis]|uniref:Spore germination protein n=1 Tax=Cohnella nanjingensis TaxID=1387779 RepID=A0A7X0VGB5_9BACL|nr:spore germination protein [Cohnella nanjingensis]MBB6672937.1 spore germination protein [Cohnella nanjingensis]